MRTGCCSLWKRWVNDILGHGGWIQAGMMDLMNRWKARFWKSFSYFLCLWTVACSPEGLLLVQLWFLWNIGSEIQELWAEMEIQQFRWKYLNGYLNIELFRSLRDFYILTVFWNLFLYVQYGFGWFSCSSATVVFRDVFLHLFSSPYFPLNWHWSVCFLCGGYSVGLELTNRIDHKVNHLT